ncbi:MAG: hypothetical protein ABIG44_16225 [Planctomycetota bacterium]
MSRNIISLCLSIQATVVACAVHAETPAAAKQDALTLTKVLTDGLRQTRHELVRGSIYWTRSTTENGFTAGRNISHSGHYELIFDGDRVSVTTREDRVTMDEQGRPMVESGRQLVERWDGRLFYGALGDGRDVRELAIMRNPRFRLYHNFLSLVFRSPIGSSTEISEELLVPSPPDGVSLHVRLARAHGQQTIHVCYEKGADRTETWYSIERGFHRIAEEWYQDGALSFQYRALVEHVSGVWFPVHIEMVSLDGAGKATLRNEFHVDLNQTQFNFEGSVADDAFRLDADSGTEVSDYRFGERLNYVVGRDVGTAAQVRALVDEARTLLREPNKQEP